MSSKYAVILKGMNLFTSDRKTIGALGEKVAAEYLRRHGFRVLDRNFTRKMGELDLIARKGDTVHFVEVKSVACDEFPVADSHGEYGPSGNLHEVKIRKVVRMAEWYMAEHDLDDEWQVDGTLVWLRRRDGRAFVRYLPQIV